MKVTYLGMSVERLDLELIDLFLKLGANIETPVPDGLSALEVAKLNFKFGQEGRFYLGWTEDGLENKVLQKLISVLGDRGLYAIAERAILETPEYEPPGEPPGNPPGEPDEKPALELFERKRSLPEIFYEHVAQWRYSFPYIKSLSIDGLLIRFGFVFSLCFAITYDSWIGVLGLIEEKNASTSLKRLIIVFLLGLVFITYFED